MMDWLGTAVGFILGVISTIFTERINIWLNRPGIKVTFTPDEHCLRYSNANVKNGVRVFITESKFFRVRVENARKYPAKGCKCLITSLRRNMPNGTSETILADTLPLRWAYLGFDPIDLPLGAQFFADVISTLQNEKHFTIELPIQPLLLQHATTASALYVIELAVVGDNFDPQRLRVHFAWKQDWDFADVWAEAIKG